MPLLEEEDELPLIWQKLSNKLLQSFNERFDKLEQSFQNLLSAQQVLTERLSASDGKFGSFYRVGSLNLVH